MAVQDAQSTTRLDDETLQELGLTEQPFQENKKRPPVSDSTTLKTRAALEQHVRFGDSLHLLIGEDDSGKTVLLQQLLKHCKSSIKPFVVKGSDEFQANALLYAVLSDLNQEEHTAESVDELVEALKPIFEQITVDQLSALLIIDDAHLAPIEEIAILVDTLNRFDSQDGKTARLLLTGTPALAQSIARYEEQFEDLNLQYTTTEMQPLDGSRMQEYLSTRLHQAGFADAFPFTDKAMAKIQQDSAGLPGRVNDSAAQYLNGVYRNGGKEGATGGLFSTGWLSSVEWPVLAIGAAAIAAIGIGLSMFFGNKPETQVIPVAANDTTTQTEQPVVAPTSVPNTVNDVNTNISQDPLVQAPLVTSPSLETPTIGTNEPSFQTNINDNNSLANAGDNTIQQIELPESTINGPTINEPTISNGRLILPEGNKPEGKTPELKAALGGTQTPPLPINGQDLTEANPTNAGLVDQGGPIELNAPAIGSQLGAEEKSVGSTNSTLRTADPLADTSLLNGSGSVSGNASGNGTIAGLDDDTDAAAPAPEDNTLDTGTNTATDPVASTRAIENERWVLFQAPQKFTVQLATSREREYIIDLAQTMEVQDPVAIYPFLTSNSNNPVFGLLSGLYDTRSEAIAAVESMSDSTKKFGVWIRPVSDLQADIKRQK